jgi:equilibrative nucleoside transporter 1/2/3
MEAEEDVPGAPEDVGNRVYWICFVLGAGILFPWNAYITAVDYFEVLYPGRHIDRVLGVNPIAGILYPKP